MQMKNELAAVAISSVLMLTACGGGGNSSNTNQTTGNLSIALTDAPADGVTAVYVSFSGVDIKPAEGEWINMAFDELRQVELVALAGDNSEPLLENIAIEAGEYKEIRLNVVMDETTDNESATYLTTDEGGSFALVVPSGNESGLKLKNTFVISAGGNTHFTIDFDLRKSIVLDGNDEYKLKPVIRIVDNLVTGHISGSLDQNQLSHESCDREESVAAVYLYNQGVTPSDISSTNDDVITAATLNLNPDTGLLDYDIGFVESGVYTLALTCDIDRDDPEIQDNTSENTLVEFFESGNVTVISGDTAEFNFN